jgi:hypothetical protein
MDGRFRQSGSDAQVLDDSDKLRLFSDRDGQGMGRPQNHPRAKVINQKASKANQAEHDDAQRNDQGGSGK